MMHEDAWSSVFSDNLQQMCRIVKGSGLRQVGGSEGDRLRDSVGRDHLDSGSSASISGLAALSLYGQPNASQCQHLNAAGGHKT